LTSFNAGAATAATVATASSRAWSVCGWGPGGRGSFCACGVLPLARVCLRPLAVMTPAPWPVR